MTTPLVDQSHRDLIAGAGNGLDRGLDQNMLVEAAAGTGKTTCMIARMVALLRTGRAETSSLVAVTFTRKAASELQSRFQAKLEQARDESEGEERANLDRALIQIEQTFIGTIHSFCARLLRERPVEAGVDVGFVELDEYSDLEIRHEAWDVFVHDLLASGDPLPRELNELGLDLSQLREIFIAFAEYPDVEAWPVDEITFTPQELEIAAGKLHELNARIEALDGNIDDIADAEQKLSKVYAAVHRRLRYLDTAKIGDLMNIIEVCRPHRTVTQKHWPGGKATTTRELAWYDPFAENIAEPLMNKWRAKRYAAVLKTVQRATKLFDELRRQRGVLTFQDLLMKATALLRENERVREVFADRFTHLLVDEFQDTDPIQAEMMMLLTADDPAESNWLKCTPRPGALFVVGDPKQSIYRFRRADIVTYNLVRERIEATGGVVVPLVTNFRALPILVEWTNLAFESLFPDKVSAYSPAYEAMSPGRPDPQARNSDLFGIRTFTIPEMKADQAAAWEAEYVADTIAGWIRDGRTIVDRETNERRHVVAGDFLLLGRRKRNFDEYARALQARGIACETSGGEAIRTAEEVASLRTALAAAMRTDDSASLVAALRGPLFGLSDEHLYDYRTSGGRFNIYFKDEEGTLAAYPRIDTAFAHLRDIAHWIRTLPPAAAMLRALARLRLEVLAGSYPDGNERTGTLIRAIELIRSIATRTATGHAATLPDLLAALDHLVDGRQIADGMPAVPNQGDAVRIMSVHVAKGLEAPIVFLLDPTSFDIAVKLHVDRTTPTPRGFLAMRGTKSNKYATSGPVVAAPLDWPKHDAEEQQFECHEETRLRYVAATRAISCLIVARQDKDTKQKKSFWCPFDRYLEGAPLLGTVSGPRDDDADLSDETVGTIPVDALAEARQQADHAITRVGTPSYRVIAAKEGVVEHVAGTRLKPDVALEIDDDDLPRGAAWGEIVHLLLEAAMKSDPTATNLARLAESSLIDAELDPTLAPRLVDIVNRVRKSDVWARAQKASRVLVEVPYQRHFRDTDGTPTMERGIIDLAFRDLYGWTLVDYKTDRIPPDNRQPWIDMYMPQVLRYAEAFAELSGEPVLEVGLYLVRLNAYVAHDLTNP